MVIDSPTGTDIIGIEDQNNDDDVHGIWLEELLQPDIQLIDTEVDTEILCTTAELEVIDNMMYTELVNDERKIETPIYQSGRKGSIPKSYLQETCYTQLKHTMHAKA